MLVSLFFFPEVKCIPDEAVFGRRHCKALLSCLIRRQMEEAEVSETMRAEGSEMVGGGGSL